MYLPWSRSFLLVAIFVVMSLAVGDAGGRQAWLAGGHVTPEQVALHSLYESLGIHEHHGHIHHLDGDVATADGSQAISAPLPTPAITSAIPFGPVGFGSVAQTRPDVERLAIVMAPAFGPRLSLTELMPSQADGTRLDPPPRRAA